MRNGFLGALTVLIVGGGMALADEPTPSAPKRVQAITLVDTSAQGLSPAPQATLAPDAALPSVITRPVHVVLPTPGISGPSAPPPPRPHPPLEFLQVLPQRPPCVLPPRHTAVLEQRHDLLHERADIAGPQPLPDRPSC